MSESDRHTCPACGEGGVTTIHDTFYACNADGCGVHYDPTRMVVTYWPVRYAIGYCPACGTNARDEQLDTIAEHENDPMKGCFECPSCEHFWSDDRVLPAEFRTGDRVVIPEAGMRVQW